MIRRPRSSPLFPNTPLFRSEPIAPGDEGAEVAGERRGVARDVDEPVRPERGEGVEGLRIDRKSTRLNSSHLVISYAVFCLKKKKYSARYPPERSPERATRIA